MSDSDAELLAAVLRRFNYLHLDDVLDFNREPEGYHWFTVDGTVRLSIEEYAAVRRALGDTFHRNTPTA